MHVLTLWENILEPVVPLPVFDELWTNYLRRWMTMGTYHCV